jgi:hypothetical protein
MDGRGCTHQNRCDESRLVNRRVVRNMRQRAAHELVDPETDSDDEEEDRELQADEHGKEILQ